MEFETIFGNAIRAALGPQASVYALLAIGLNVHYGYTGLLNFGIVGFMLVGAYGLAISVVTLGLSMWVGIPIGLAAAAALGLLLGIPTLRLRADYFAITTIAVAEILRLMVRSSPLEDVTGGVLGLQGVANSFYVVNPYPEGDYGWGVLSFSDERMWVLTVTWILVAVATVFVALLIRSPWGRALRSIREDEDAARSLGKNAFGFKLQSLVIGGVIAGTAGVMFAIRASAANADAFQPEVTFFAYTVLILGGAATRLGPIAGAVIFWFLFAGVDSFLRQALEQDLFPGFLGGSEAVGAMTNILVGVGLILLMIFRPQGIFGSREEMQLDA